MWPLVYTGKNKAVRALKEDFMEGVDYQLITLNGQKLSIKGLGVKPTTEYWISVRCLEFFMARRIREVFEVYRSVFDRLSNPSASDLAQLVLSRETSLRALQSENSAKDEEIARLTPKARL